MRKKAAEEIDLKRRVFLLESGAAFGAVLVASLLFFGVGALAEDGEDDSEEDSGDDGEDDASGNEDEEEDDNGGSGSGSGGNDDRQDGDNFERGTLDQSDAVARGQDRPGRTSEGCLEACGEPLQRRRHRRQPVVH